MKNKISDENLQITKDIGHGKVFAPIVFIEIIRTLKTSLVVQKK